jgi:hypothetical protein
MSVHPLSELRARVCQECVATAPYVQWIGKKLFDFGKDDTLV